MKIREGDCTSPSFLTSAMNAAEHGLAAFTFRKAVTSYRSLGGPQSHLDVVKKRKPLAPVLCHLSPLLEQRDGPNHFHISSLTWEFVGNNVNDLQFEIGLPVVLYGYETWSLTLREEHRLRVFENRVLRRIFLGRRGMRWRENGESCIMRSFMICTLRQV
jgi:hypothetical protein